MRSNDVSATTNPVDSEPEGPFASEAARRAARHSERPGEKCRALAGAYRPRVDRRRCEGKSECVAVCPYDVFEVRTIDEHEYRTLPMLARLKLRVHGKQTAYTPRADACRACGLCVVACPERAIKLVASDELP
jgi:NAD-dependent dihydropyrimidine dehydrogenase PreA subunit